MMSSDLSARPAAPTSQTLALPRDSPTSRAASLARKKVLAERISELAIDPAWWPTVARLRAFRGVDTLTVLAIHLELGADWQRFQNAHRVGSWLGLTPSRSQSGERDRHGHVTKSGSMLARRMIVEAASHSIREPRIGVTLATSIRWLPGPRGRP
jgi:transposase